MQNNSKINTVLLIVVIILLCIGIWFLAEKRGPEMMDDMMVPVGQTQTNLDPNGPDYQPVSHPTFSTALPTPYVNAQSGWPPVIQSSPVAYSCTTGRVGMGAPTNTTEKIINGRTYCVAVTDEGAAGTIYYTYTYTTASGTGTKTTHFTLAYPDSDGCNGHGTPEENKCQTAQLDFKAKLDLIIDSLM